MPVPRVARHGQSGAAKHKPAVSQVGLVIWGVALSDRPAGWPASPAWRSLLDLRSSVSPW